MWEAWRSFGAYGGCFATPDGVEDLGVSVWKMDCVGVEGETVRMVCDGVMFVDGGEVMGACAVCFLGAFGRGDRGGRCGRCEEGEE